MRSQLTQQAVRAPFFFSPQSFVEVVDTMKLDPYLQPHIRYYMREIRVVVYSQVRRGNGWKVWAGIMTASVH